MSNPSFPRAILFAATVLAVTSPALAEDLFSLVAQATSGAPAGASAAGSDLVDLVNNLVDSEDAFVSLNGRDVAASLTYGGVEDAVLVSRNASGNSATITLPTTGFTRTFTGADADDVNDQIKDFLLKDGAEEYAEFLRTINEQSPIGVVDGNPLAGTALIADTTFSRFGLHRGAMGPVGNIIRHGGGTRFDATYGTADTDVGDGYFTTFALSGLIRFGPRVALSLGPSFTYRDIEGAKVYHLAGHIGLPIILVAPEGDRSGVVWQVTPAFVTGASGSVDLAAGGTLLGGGVTSSLRIPLGERFAIDVANQFTFFEGYPIHFQDYDFETDLSQQILKNGVRLSYLFADNVYIDGAITHTKFLEDAAVDDYLSPGAGLGFYFSRRHSSGLRVAYQANLADEVKSHAGTVQLYFNY